MTIIGAGIGNKRCVYSDDSNRLNMRDVNLFVSDSLSAKVAGGSYIGIETVNVDSIVQIKSSSVNGNAYSGSSQSADISQTRGIIKVGFTDLVNRSANNISFTSLSAQLFYTFAVNGKCSNEVITGGRGVHFSNTFLVPGTITFSDFTGTSNSIVNYFPIKVANDSLVTTMTYEAINGPGGTISTFAVLYKNSVAQSQFKLSLSGSETLKYLSTSSITIKKTDTFGIFLSTSSSNTAMTYPFITMTLY
jgi:hypothetical protein